MIFVSTKKMLFFDPVKVGFFFFSLYSPRSKSHMIFFWWRRKLPSAWTRREKKYFSVRRISRLGVHRGRPQRRKTHNMPTWRPMGDHKSQNGFFPFCSAFTRQNVYRQKNRRNYKTSRQKNAPRVGLNPHSCTTCIDNRPSDCCSTSTRRARHISATLAGIW